MVVVDERETGRCENFDRRVNVQVVVFALDLEVFQTFDQRRGTAADVDGVFHAVAARMAYPLAAGHELPFGVVAEGVAHTAVAACETYAVTDCLADVAGEFAVDLAARPAGYDEVEIHQLVEIAEAFERVENFYFVVVLFKHSCEALGGQLRFVSVPTALENQCFFHFESPF